MLSESSQHFRSLWSAGVKSKYSFHLANSGVTAFLLFFFNQLLCNLPIKDMQVQKRTISPASFSLTHPICIWDLICRADSCSFSLCLLCSFPGLHCYIHPTHFWCLAQYSRTRGVHSCATSPRFCMSSSSISLLFHLSVTKHILNFLYSWA